jgi:hypothetical protein
VWLLGGLCVPMLMARQTTGLGAVSHIRLGERQKDFNAVESSKR